MRRKPLIACLGIAAILMSGIGIYAYQTFLALSSVWDRSEMRVALPALCFDPMEERTTPDGVAFIRTRTACFEGLPDWLYETRFVAIDGLQQGYVEAGSEDGEILLMRHGQPSGAYLYRFMIPVLADRGYRVIAMDHLGFGTSDKPVDPAYHSLTNHADRLAAFMDTGRPRPTPSTSAGNQPFPAGRRGCGNRRHGGCVHQGESIAFVRMAI
ncbi:alpha/beta fold hydrolase [Aestuariibius sp. 2305UL40-4]|uniref:alpha/beta fold hydrolase n=1 Tax=Aestuariibius violaceus TaxID=3234132 RepID=UPI00345EF6C5